MWNRYPHIWGRDMWNFPVAMEKTEWATTIIVFLGMLFDTKRQVIAIPLDKKEKAIKLLLKIRNEKKTTVLHLQQLTGLLNYLCKSIFAGLAYLHNFHTRTIGLKRYHHVNVNSEMCLDAGMWLTLLTHDATVSRPFVDLSINVLADEIDFFSDASATPDKGFSCVFGRFWTLSMWQPGYIQKYGPSSDYLELYAVSVAILLWAKKLQNRSDNFLR